MEETVKIIEHIKSFLRNEDGAELAEYAVAVALLVAIALIVYILLGDAISDSTTGTAAKVTSATWTPPSGT
jgi:Flp pilus assembly pilin Flp